MPKSVFFVVLLLQQVFCDVDDKYLDPKKPVQFDPIEYIRSHGYEVEKHHVVTEDGYILAIFRVRSPEYNGQWLQPILLQHGLLNTGLVYLVGGPGGGTIEIDKVDYDTGERKRIIKPSSNLGFLLADHSYDVWLANSRGNTYSTNHTTLNPFKDAKFWDFSVQDHALKDLPAVIKYIVKQTKAETLGYIGHSQGTLMALWLLSEKPEISNFLEPVVLLAPIADTTQYRTPISIFFDPTITRSLKHNPGQLLARTGFIESLINSFCKRHGFSSLCKNALSIFGELYSPQLNATRIPILEHVFPAGTSRKVFTHYGQAAEKGYFSYYDEGIIKNIALYGSPVPPRVRFDRINSTSIACITSSDDAFATESEVRIFDQLLKVRLMDFYQVPYDLFSHMDLVWGKQVGLLVNQRVLQIMDKFFKNKSFKSND